MARFDGVDARIIAITTDSPTKNGRIAKELEISFPILSDPEGKVLKQLDMWDARWKISAYGFYLLDKRLRVIARRRGYWKPNAKTLGWFIEQFESANGASS